MPTYAYRCEQCEAVAEQAHGIGEDPVIVCADCGGLMRRIVDAAPTILTGRQEKQKKIDQTAGSGEDPHAHDDHGSGCVLHRHPTQDH